MKRTPGAGPGALHPDVAAYHRHQVSRNGQTQTDTTIHPRRGAIALPESFKNQTLVSLRNANARISHRPVEDNLVGCMGGQGNADGDAALGGELHSIVDKA